MAVSLLKLKLKYEYLFNLLRFSVILLIGILVSEMLNAQDLEIKSSCERVRKNSIYLEILGNGAVWSINYDRIIPLKNDGALIIRTGGNEYHSHFTGSADRLVVLTTGYRYQGFKGLIIRITPMYIYNTEKGDTFGNSLWIGASTGFSF